MMATTHALVGAAIAAVTAVVFPGTAPIALAAAVAGSVFPDLDLYAGHRRTLHYPAYYWVALAAVLVVAALSPTPHAVAAVLFVLGAAVHSVMDAFGGGLELRPWEGTSDRAVYDHLNGRWLPPKRWVPYDGAPADLLLAGVLSAPALLVFGDEPLVRGGLVGVLVVSAAWVTLRRRVASVSERLAASLPASLQGYVPERFIAGD
ncbi:MAG: metal-dependent hydrolase [Haloarculaceae archaeon]